MRKTDDALAFVLGLNQPVANQEDAGQKVTGPGLLPSMKNKSKFVTTDCISLLVEAGETAEAAYAEGVAK